MANVKGQFVGEGQIDETKSTIQSLVQFASEGYWLPAFLILIFSLVVPLIKLVYVFHILHCYMANLLPHMDADAVHGRLRTLRMLAKYQMLDVFLTVLMVAFLNQDVLVAEVRPGFLYFTMFGILSLAMTQALSQMVSRRLPQPKPRPSADKFTQSAVSDFIRCWLLRAACVTYAIGLSAALVKPILTVKVTFDKSLIVSESTQTLSEVAWTLLDHAHHHGQTRFQYLPAVLLIGLGVALPTLFVALAFLGTIAPSPALSRILEAIADWHMADVLALALLTLLLSLNSFESLSAETPGSHWTSGFYFVLLMGAAAADLGLSQVSSLVDTGRHLPVANQENGEMALLLSKDSSSVSKHPDPEPPITWTECACGFLAALSGPVLLFKAAMWGIFFALWFLHPDLPTKTLEAVNVDLERNLARINAALQATAPQSFGACKTAPHPCLESGDLYQHRGTLYEVRARWISGLKSTEIRGLVLSSPHTGKLELSLRGVVHSLPMSLYIGYILPGLASTGALWDNTEACCGTDKAFHVVFRADCHENPPYVSHLAVHKVTVDPLPIHETVVGIDIPLTDISDAARGALAKFFQPLLEGSAFIPWGADQLTVGQLLTKLIALNVGRGNPFSCPAPPGG